MNILDKLTWGHLIYLAFIISLFSHSLIAQIVLGIIAGVALVSNIIVIYWRL